MERAFTQGPTKRHSMVPAPTGRRSWLTEGIVLAAIPVMAYLLAYGHEYGYYLAYGFPLELINLDLDRVFAAGVIFIAGVLLMLVLTSVVLAILPSEHPLAPAVAHAVAYTLAYLIFLVYLGQFDAFGWIFGVLLGGFLLYKFAVSVLSQRGVHGYVEKFRRHEQMQQSQRTLFRAILRTFGAGPGNVLTYFVIACILSVTFGWHLATEREYYFVIPGQPERVVLRIYEDSVILARLDRGTGRILREYTVLRRTAGTITVREEHIGPLTVWP